VFTPDPPDGFDVKFTGEPASAGFGLAVAVALMAEITVRLVVAVELYPALLFT
jgi:hypothetical protein